MKVKRTLLTLLVASGSFAVAARPAFPGEHQSVHSAQTQPTAEQPPTAAPAAVPGMTIHVDPKTGAILKEPAPGTVPLQLTPQLRNALSTSHQGLVEAPSSVAGGGVKLDLQGRFQSPVVVTIDADGKVRLQHLEATPH